jgi:tryptophanyl-tRNA synthetase
MNRYMADPAEIDRILADGAERARTMARETVTAVKDIIGFVQTR